MTGDTSQPFEGFWDRAEDTCSHDSRGLGLVETGQTPKGLGASEGAQIRVFCALIRSRHHGEVGFVQTIESEVIAKVRECREIRY